MSGSNKKKRSTQSASPDQQADSTTESAEQARGDLAEFELLIKPRFAVALIGWGLLGLAFSVSLSMESAERLANPDYDPACSINPLVSCLNSMDSFVGNLFGFPNAYLGTVLFAVLIVFGAWLLMGIRFPRWVWYGLCVGLLGGMGFVVFFLFVSVFSLKTLCPYCMVVWLATVPIFVLGMAYLFQERYIPAPEGLRRFWVRHRVLLTAGILTGIAVVVIVGFADKWHLMF